MGFWFFTFFELTTVFIVFRFGHFEEKSITSILMVNFVATGLLYNSGGADWLEPEVEIFVLDIFTLIILIGISLRSKRFWPMPVAAFQLIPVLVVVLTKLGLDLGSFSVGLLLTIWGYLQMIILIWAALRSKKRAMLNQNGTSH